MATFETALSLDCSRETVFEFLLSPDNVADLSPPEVDMRIVQGPEMVVHGSQVEFEVVGFGQVQRSVHEIIEIEYPARLVEQQISGPLQKWVHEHLFEPETTGGVRLIDRIEFLPPGGLVGLLINENRILDHLQRAFAFRHDLLQERLAGK